MKARLVWTEKSVQFAKAKKSQRNYMHETHSQVTHSSQRVLTNNLSQESTCFRSHRRLSLRSVSRRYSSFEVEHYTLFATVPRRLLGPGTTQSELIGDPIVPLPSPFLCPFESFPLCVDMGGPEWFTVVEERCLVR